MIRLRSYGNFLTRALLELLWKMRRCPGRVRRPFSAGDGVHRETCRIRGMHPRPARKIRTGTFRLLGWQVSPRDGAMGLKTHGTEGDETPGPDVCLRVPLHLGPNVREGDTPLMGRPCPGWWL